MKIFILIAAAFICCHCQTPTSAPAGTTAAAVSVKERLLQRVVEVETRVRNEITKLLDENRGHLALVLEDELRRIEALGNELMTTEPGPEALRLLEEEIFATVNRVDLEVQNLARQSATQDQLLFAARLLRGFVQQELLKLEATEGRDRERALEAAAGLRRDEQRLETLVQELLLSQEERDIARLEVEVRAIETRVEDELRRLGFTPATVTPRPATVTSRPATTPAAPVPSTPGPPSTPRM